MSWKLAVSVLIVVAVAVAAIAVTPAPDAPIGLDNLTNGLVDQATHASNGAAFAFVVTPADGLGPMFNDTSCAICHQDAGVIGTGSQVRELRVGYLHHRQFVNPDMTLPSGEVIHARSLINLRAICPQAAGSAPEDVDVTAFRLALPVLGDGFIEAIPDSAILAFAADQCRASGGRICGLAIQVPITEAPDQTGVGRFGWKDQHRSLLSFSADAFLNEMGMTSPLQPAEVATTCNPASVPEPNGVPNTAAFAEFMRATKAPGPDPLLIARPVAQAGGRVFERTGCAFCHFANWTTAPAGTSINGGQFIVPNALANQTIHPYSDFLLHNIGTGDGIVQNGGPQSRNRIRTPPLWGLRLRTNFMHDGNSATLTDAIERHGGEASRSAQRFANLSPSDKQALLEFLRSL
jgi:CxxC motif-containing protein (DUF1111 family)